MSIPVIAFFNNKGGVGKTSLVYHLAWMYSDHGLRVVAADLDPQANLTSAFLGEDRLTELWPDGEHTNTIYGALRPLIRGVGDVTDQPHREIIESSDDHLALLVGDLGLSRFEDQLSEVWPKCLDGDERAFRVISAFWRLAQFAAEAHDAKLILIDLGPNLGAINRAALIAADYVVIPLAPDLFSLQGLRNLGPALREWRKGWGERLNKTPTSELQLPPGNMKPVGYIVLQHAVRLDRPVQAYNRWIARIPVEYAVSVLDEDTSHILPGISVETDLHRLALLKHYRSLMPMAQEARKPIFALKPADGAIGSHTRAVREAYSDFEALAQQIADRTAIPFPTQQFLPGLVTDEK